MIFFFVLILLSVQLFFLVNLQFTAWPEIISYPYLKNQDFLLYKDLIHPYPPVLTLTLSVVYKFFGYNLWVIIATAWIIILSSSIILYLLSKELTKSNFLSVLALSFYVLTQPFFEGNMLWFDMAIIPPTLLGIYFTFRFITAFKKTPLSGDELNPDMSFSLRRETADSQSAENVITKYNSLNLFFASMLFTVASLTKQTAALFLIALGLLVIQRFTVKRALIYIVTPFSLLSLLLLKLAQEDSIQDFINWTILYPVGEWSKIPGYVQMSLNKSEAISVLILIVPVFILYIVRRKYILNTTSLLLFAFLLLSLVMIYPRFSYFHFQLSLAILVVYISYLLRLFSRKNAVLIWILLLVMLYLPVHKNVLVFDWNKDTRFYSQQDINLAKKISNNIRDEKRIYLLGIHSGNYAFADIIPSKRWTDNFPWYLEINGVQEEIIERWEQNLPDIILWKRSLPGNIYDLGTYQPQIIVEYVRQNYKFEKTIDLDIEVWVKVNK